MRDELAKVEVLPRFEDLGGTKSRLGLALTIAYDELPRLRDRTLPEFGF
jgi:hypothetical protein